MLTKKQKELFVYLNDYISSYDISPSFEEMKNAVNLKSKSGIHRLISGLEERGFIKKLSHRARAIEILRYPSIKQEQRESLKKLSKNNVSEISVVQEYNGDSLTLQVPLMGKIAAGSPLEAINDFSHNLDVPQHLLGKGNHYALEVKGESMTGAGIMNGDTILVKEQEYANNGEIVVALVSGQEATLKKFIKNGDQVRLKAENEAFEDQIYQSSEVQIQGKLVALLRAY